MFKTLRAMVTMLEHMLTGTMESKKWDESAYAGIEGAPRLAVVDAVDLFHGDIEGEGTYRGVTVTALDGSGSFLSLIRLVGRVGGRAGSLVLRAEGTFDASGSTATWTVVSGSGTGDLHGIEGGGGFESGEAGSTYTLDVS